MLIDQGQASVVTQGSTIGPSYEAGSPPFNHWACLPGWPPVCPRTQDEPAPQPEPHDGSSR